MAITAKNMLVRETAQVNIDSGLLIISRTRLTIIPTHPLTNNIQILIDARVLKIFGIFPPPEFVYLSYFTLH
jgi:hypothetical protein